MYIARILYPVEVLGPGKRIGIWFCGCPHRCPGCSNPELWDIQERYLTSVSTVIDMIRHVANTYPVDGFTITGGEPFFQGKELLALTCELSKISDDILAYSGYKIEKIPPHYLEHISVLIDGPYIEAQNCGIAMRGSLNQQIHILQEHHRHKYEAYIGCTTNQIQNFSTTDGTISVGIHQPGFMDALDSMVKNKGLEESAHVRK